MKYLKLYLEYVTLNQGANLAIDNTPKQITFDGGDGPSSMNIEPTYKKVKKSKIKRGSNIKKKKKRNREKEINQSLPYLIHSNPFGNNGQGNSPGGGGADYTLQGF